MYEYELENAEFRYQLTPEQLERFKDREARITHRTVLDWGEHCTECAAPACYQTCDFFEARSDGKCRRFEGGVTERSNAHAATGKITGIRFKKWGKLWAPGSLTLFTMKRAETIEKRFRGLARTVRGMPMTNARIAGRTVQGSLRGRRRRWAEGSTPRGPEPSYLLVEVLNPGKQPASLNIEISTSDDVSHAPLIRSYQITGFQRIKLPCTEISEWVDMRKPFNIDLIPATEEGSTDLVFGMTELVHDQTWSTPPDTKTSAATHRRKMIVWDLDNTLWKGILVEDGLENLALNEAAASAIRELDRRGILHGVASKNDAPQALAAIRHFGLEEYFLYPQIHWNPKTASLREIAEQMNLGLDSLVFIDDSAFERAEVSNSLPQILCLDVDCIPALCDMEAFDVPVTADSKRRREYYRNQQQRDTTAQAFGSDYQDFLRDCRIELDIHDLDDSNLQRAYELAQRTNQMNFSGNRYSLDDLKCLKDDAQKECLILKCRDRFGDYGIIGFCVYLPAEARMLDLMFSCRVQSRHVDFSFLAWLIRRAAEQKHDRMLAEFRPTERNKLASHVFEELGFVVAEEGPQGQLLERRLQDLPEGDDIVTMTDQRGAD